MILEFRPILGIPDVKLIIKRSFFEDNKGAEELVNVSKNRPRIKHITIKYYHFHEAVKSNILLVKRVDTID